MGLHGSRGFESPSFRQFLSPGDNPPGWVLKHLAGPIHSD